MRDAGRFAFAIVLRGHCQGVKLLVFYSHSRYFLALFARRKLQTIDVSVFTVVRRVQQVKSHQLRELGRPKKNAFNFNESFPANPL